MAGARSAVALGGFSVGVIIGAVLVAESRSRPAASAVVLLLESLVMLAVLAGWAAVGVPAGTSRYLLLGGAGGTMGLQSTAALATTGGGVPTTYVTGTLTRALASLTRRVVSRSADAPRARHSGNLAGVVWLLYGAGALGGALAEVSWHAAALVGPAAIVCLIAAGAVRVARRAD